MAAHGYTGEMYEQLFDVFASLTGGKKDLRILDVGAGTGLSGAEVNKHCNSQ